MVSHVVGIIWNGPTVFHSRFEQGSCGRWPAGMRCSGRRSTNMYGPGRDAGMTQTTLQSTACSALEGFIMFNRSVVWGKPDFWKDVGDMIETRQCRNIHDIDSCGLNTTGLRGWCHKTRPNGVGPLNDALVRCSRRGEFEPDDPSGSDDLPPYGGLGWQSSCITITLFHWAGNNGQLSSNVEHFGIERWGAENLDATWFPQFVKKFAGSLYEWLNVREKRTQRAFLPI